MMRSCVTCGAQSPHTPMRGDDGEPFPELKLAWRKIETSMAPGVHAGTKSGFRKPLQM